MPFLRTGDIITHYELTGPSGAPVVMFANSLGTNFHVFDPQEAALAPYRRVLRYDMRGHGLSDVPTPGNGYAMDQLAQDALALLDALRLGKVDFCGLSIGGMVGQIVAARAPERVGRLVLCDTAPVIGTAQSWDDRIAAIRRGGLASIADAVLSRWFTPGFLGSDTALGAKNMLVRTPDDGYIGCCGAIRGTDLGTETGLIACPTLVVVGADDLATPPEAARAMAASITGARLETVAQAGHIPTLEQPAALNELLGGFLVAGAR